MSTLGIFLLGLFVMCLTVCATLMVGLQEASDESLTRVEDLTEFEKKTVGRSKEVN
jgi:hypothetical protein